ncbi:hypothetical protein NSA11_06255 [Lactobacillus taiwanensis]|uniref:hypothetical protein n=1 Tax=Lactobacillus taiwanensis TaxID=508451 RepID=UPI00214B343D|nr:hypothetical protein [Lactobacillus taiwanensis]
MFNKSGAELKRWAQISLLGKFSNSQLLWKETFDIYQEKKTEIDDFLTKIIQKFNKVKVIFTGQKLVLM